jgi:hypothetical protein
LRLSVDVEQSTLDLVLTPSLDVVPDFVDGWAFGNAVGVCIRSTSSKWWVVSEIIMSKSNPVSVLTGTRVRVSLQLDIAQDGVRVELMSLTSIAPTQTRLIPLKLTQAQPVGEAKVTFDLVIIGSDGDTLTLPVILNFTRQRHWSTSCSNSLAIKATYFYSSLTPTAFLVKPPLEADEVRRYTRPPVIALRE